WVASRRLLCGSGRGPRCQEGLGELRAGADLELAVSVAQVHLDGLDRDEERLRDLLVAHPLGCELCNAPLACGERVEPRLKDFSRPPTGGGNLFVPAPGKSECADLLREIDALPESLACLGPLVRAPEGCSEVDEGARVLETRFRTGELFDRLTKQPDSCFATLDETERAQGGANRLG